MITVLPDKLKELLREMLNEFWISNHIPNSWREYMVVFIDKSKKEKVRPISLLSCLCKILERIVNARLSWRMEKYNIIDNSQMGLRKGKGCLENLTKLVVDAKVNFHRNKSTLVAFLDVSSAYDNVEYKVLINKLDEIKCPARIRNFISNWMLYKNIEFIVDNELSIKKVISKGLPQEAVISPNLYSIYTSKITKGLKREMQVLQFADNIAIYICIGKRQENKKEIRKGIKIIKKKPY